MSGRRSDSLTPGLAGRDVFLALFVIEDGLVDPADVHRILLTCLSDPQLSVGQTLVQDGKLTGQQLEQIQERVEKILADRMDTLALEGPSGIQLLSDQEELKRLVTEQSGRYSDRTIHARGGQGRIIRAFDEFIGRQVAIKEFVPDRSLETTTTGTPSIGLVRFLREARITGQLEHPNIVPVHELGRREDGTFYYSMRMVRGDTLAHRISGSGTLADRLKLLGPFWDVCNAIAYAHKHGVVHRDIKPSNIMVGDLGETVLLDWGIAKVGGEEDARASDIQRNLRRLQELEVDKTLDGATLGTPSYMSPEQAQGEVEEIDERSDVWSLGAMLYEILTGCPPFHHESAIEIITQVVERQHPPVAQLCPEAPAELVAVVERALSKNKELRYQDARELAGEIGAYMTGGKVRAYDYSSWELVKRFAAKNKAIVFAGGLVTVVVLVALVLVWFAYQREASERLQKQQALASEHTQRLNASYHLAQALARQSKLLFEKKALLTSRIYAAASLVNNPTSPGSPYHEPDFVRSRPESAGLVSDATSMIYLANFRPVRRIGPVAQTPAATLALAISPDGSRLAATDYGGNLLVWDAGDMREVARKPAHQGRAYGLAYSPDGRQVATGGKDGKLHFFDTADWEIHRSIPVGREVSRISYSPDSKRLAYSSSGKRLDVIQVATSKRLASTRLSSIIRALAFSSDGNLLAAGDKSGQIHLLDGRTLKVRAVLRGHGDRVMGVSFSPDDRTLLSASFDKTARLWEIPSGKLLQVLAGHQEAVRSVVFIPGTSLAASASDDRQVFLWAPAAGDLLMRLDGHAEAINMLVADPQGRFLASASWDRSVRQWLLDTQALPRRYSITSNLYSMSLAPDGKLLTTSSDRSSTLIWNRASGKSRRVPGSKANGAAILRDNRSLITLEESGDLRIWSLESLDLIREWKAHKGALMYMDESPDGKLLASCGMDGTVHLWETASGKQIGKLSGHEKMTLSLAFSPASRYLASGSMDKSIRIWEVSTSKEIKKLDGHTDWAFWVEFSPDGKWLVSAGKDGNIIIWAADGWKESGRLIGHDGVASTIAFSPDGRLVATGSYDNSAIIWDFASRKELLRILIDGAVVDVEFTPDGSHLAVAAYHSVVLYPLEGMGRKLDPVKLLTTGEDQAGYVLKGFDLEAKTKK